MKRENRVVQLSGWGLSLVMVLVMMVTSIAGQDAGRKKFLKKPLVIEDQGSFFIGGVPKVTTYATLPAPNNPNPPAPNQITIGQMYVQFQIPANKKSKAPPVIMVHGSTHTAACLESTPDGREGWAPYFVRNGISTYIVDQAGRGRSGFDQSVIHEAAAMIRSGDVQNGTARIPNFGRITDNGAWTAWFGHLMPAGSTILTGTLMRHGDPGDPPTDDASHKDTYLPAYPMGAVDPSIVSRTGAIAAGARGTEQLLCSRLLQATCPQCGGHAAGFNLRDLRAHGLSPANTWTPRDLALLVEKLGGAVVATHSQSGIMGHHMVRILKERGHLDLVKGLITIEGGCSLPNSGLKAEDFDNIPYMALKGDYAATSCCARRPSTRSMPDAPQGKGIAKAEYIKLDELGPDLQRHNAHDDARYEQP